VLGLSLSAANIIEAQGLLRLVSSACFAALAVKLWRQDLRKGYPFFFWYVTFRLLRAVVLLPFPTNRTIYGYLFIPTELVLWVFYVLVVLELYRLVLRDFKGIATLGRWVVLGALSLSVLLSLLSLAPDLSSRQAYPILQAVFVMGRAICSSLAIFLLLITAFLVFYPVPLSRNVIVHTVVYAVYFLSLTMTYFVRNVAGPDVVLPLNIVLQAVTVLTLLAWIVLLSPAGEQVVISVRPRWAPEEEQRLVRNLDSINAALLRAARK